MMAVKAAPLIAKAREREDPIECVDIGARARVVRRKYHKSFFPLYIFKS